MKNIAMWSGPRHMSTAVMRSFSSRNDTIVIDEPFYGYFLEKSGQDRPYREEIIAATGGDWEGIVAKLISPLPDRIFFQKHMAHYVASLPRLDWLNKLTNFFLIRDPMLVASSYFERSGRVSLASTGLPDLINIFEAVSKITGSHPVAMDLQQPAPEHGHRRHHPRHETETCRVKSSNPAA